MEGTVGRSENAPQAASEGTKDGPRRWKVFVSSTSTGLKDFRNVARNVIDGFTFDGTKCFEPEMMEDWGAQDATARELCAAKMRDCDLMVGIVGIRYGEHPVEEQTSYTELEFETAGERRISRLMFVLRENVAAVVEKAAPQEADRADRQRRFRERVTAGLVVELDVASAAAFEQKLKTALGNWVRDYSFKRALVDHSVEFTDTRRRLLSLTGPPGGAAMIFGEPGTGKTTLFNALLNDPVVKGSFAHLVGPVTVRLAAGADEVRQRQAEVQSAIDELVARRTGGRVALPAVLIALHLEPDIDTGVDVDPSTLGELKKLFTWDVPCPVVLAETNNHSVRRRLEQDLGWPADAVTTVNDYTLVGDALEQMRRDAPYVHHWPEPDTQYLAEALGLRPISLFAAAKDLDMTARGASRRVPARIRQQLAAIAHEESPEGRYGALLRGSIDKLSDDARELLALMTVLHPKPTLFPDEMAVALDLSLDLDEAIAIVTAEEDERQLDADEQAHLDEAYDLVGELVDRGLLERMPRQGAGRDEPELLTLHPANVRVIHDYLPLDEEKRDEGHARAEAFYRARVGQAVSGSFDSRFRMESSAWWDDVEQWIYHLGHTTPDQAGISFTTLIMDACWWWDLYIEFDSCGKLLEYASRPRVQAISAAMPKITKLLAKFRAIYPREYERTRGEVMAELAGDDPVRTGRLQEADRTGTGVLPVLQQLCDALDITELAGLSTDGASGQTEPAAGPDPEALAAADQTRQHLLGLLCLLMAEGYWFHDSVDPEGTALASAAACYQTAERCFLAEDNAWDLAWTRYWHGEAVAASGQEDPGPMWDEAADGADGECDTELLGCIERGRAGDLLGRGDLDGALAHYGRAVFYGLALQVTSNLKLGADRYTQAFYAEMRLHATKMVAEPLLADPPSPAEAQRRLEVMLAQWGGHWKPEQGWLDGALGSDSQRDVEKWADGIANAAFFPGPGNAVLLKPDSEYYRQVNDLIEKTRKQPWVRGLARWEETKKETG
jgi:Domain of unknown function (DUF4062)